MGTISFKGASFGLNIHGYSALKLVIAGYLRKPTSNLTDSTLVPGLGFVRWVMSRAFPYQSKSSTVWARELPRLGGRSFFYMKSLVLLLLRNVLLLSSRLAVCCGSFYLRVWRVPLKTLITYLLLRWPWLVPGAYTFWFHSLFPKVVFAFMRYLNSWRSLRLSSNFA